MKAKGRASRKARAAAKAASRQDDIARLQSGEDAEALQRENSALSSEFLGNAKIRNLSSAIGRQWLTAPRQKVETAFELSIDVGGIRVLPRSSFYVT